MSFETTCQAIRNIVASAESRKLNESEIGTERPTVIRMVDFLASPSLNLAGEELLQFAKRQEGRGKRGDRRAARKAEIASRMATLSLNNAADPSRENPVWHIREREWRTRPHLP